MAIEQMLLVGGPRAGSIVPIEWPRSTNKFSILHVSMIKDEVLHRHAIYVIRQYRRLGKKYLVAQYQHLQKPVEATDKALEQYNVRGIGGLKVDCCWIEEASTMSQAAYEGLVPHE